MTSSKDPTWLNILLLAAIFLTLCLLLLNVYRGWKEDRMLHYSGPSGHSEIIADITVNLGGLPRREHCLTCHPQGKRVTYSGGSPVFRNHPNIAPHSIDDLGCTGCHLGEGMARELKISHGRGARKVLSGEDLQASCFRCHELKPLQGAEKAWEGIRHFSSNACNTCHNVEGLAGGVYGPDLSDVGSFLGLRQIQTAIEDPKADLENSIMPKFSLSPEQVKSLAFFLKSRTKESFHETPMMKKVKIQKQARVEEDAKKTPASGQDLLREKKCLACHKFKEEDGKVGPDLTFTAYMRDEGYIKNFLYSPGREIPGAIMPWVRLNAQEEKALLSLLGKKDGTGHFHGKRPKHLYMALCQRCHAAQGDGLGTIQPNLANFPRAFWKNAEFFRMVADERMVKSIERGVPGTSMPPYGELVGREAISSLIDLIFREFIKIKRTDKGEVQNVPPPKKILLAKEQTEMVFKKHCSDCHGVAGNGRGPEYHKYVPRPRDLTNQPYFAGFDDQRIAQAIYSGVPGTGMSSFSSKLSLETIWSLVKKVRDLSRTRQGGGGKANG